MLGRPCVTSRVTAGAFWLASTIALAIDERPGEIFLRAFTFSIGTSSLAEIRETLGPAKLLTTGFPDHGGMPAYGICYVAPLSGVRFGFKATGPRRSEMQSSDFWVTVEDQAHRGSEHREGDLGSCFALAEAVENRLTFNFGGLRLGMTRDEFRRAVGRTTTNDRGDLVAEFTQREPGVARVKGRETVVLVEGAFDSRGLSRLSVWRLSNQSAGGPTKE